MDRLFATLFVLYIAGSFLVAIIRKLRTEPGPSLPPVVRPDAFPWPLEGESDLEPSVETQTPRVQERALTEAEAQPSLPPGDEYDRLSLDEVEPALPVPEPFVPVAGPKAAGTPAKVGARAVSRRALQGRAALTPAKVREALILAEIVAPPRALRPYTPFPWRR